MTEGIAAKKRRLAASSPEVLPVAMPEEATIELAAGQLAAVQAAQLPEVQLAQQNQEKFIQDMTAMAEKMEEVPAELPPPPPVMEMVTADCSDSFDPSEQELFRAAEAARKAREVQDREVAEATARLLAAKKVLEEAEAHARAAETRSANVQTSAAAVRTACEEATAKFETYMQSRPVCMNCKKFSARPVIMSLTCGHLLCRACANDYLSKLLAQATSEDKPVMCPCCAGNVPVVPQHSFYKKEVAALVPAAARGYVDPCVLKGIDPTTMKGIAMHQLAFPEFVCAPLAPGVRPARTFCPKCKITPTYGLSNPDLGVARCTNPHCCELYCTKCGKYPYHIGTSCTTTI